jgi:two-component system, cell cycle sensor histidine kinase and response regulator CckA
MSQEGAGGSPASRARSRQAIEKMLRNSERTLLALLESASQAILTIDPAGRITLANAKTAEMFGYSREQLLGSPIEVLLPVASRAAHEEHRREYFASPRVRPMGIGMVLAGRRRDGTDFPVEVSLSYVESEEEVFAIAFVTDVTERKKLEEQLLQSQKMEAIGRLAGGVAHDFNNMLTIISGYNRMVLDQLSPMDRLRGFHEEIGKAAERAESLTKQLLAFSRRQLMQPRVIDVNELLGHADKLLRRLIGEDIELILALAPGAGTIRADPGHIEQAVFNLAVNARDAMPRGGRLVIETGRVRLDEIYARTHTGVKPGDYVMIAVSDTGTGMDAETRGHIFEPFFTTKEQGKGTGLGLPMVYGTVKQSEGDIWVYSEPGRGTTFKLYFPQTNENPETLASVESPRAARGTETLMVVEDEDSVRELVATMLRQAGYTVLGATGAEQAVEIWASHKSPIAMLITDVVMPYVSGRQLAGQLLESHPDLKILFLSGYTENSVVHNGVLDAGVNFLAKPFSQEQLARKVREVLDK